MDILIAKIDAQTKHAETLSANLDAANKKAKDAGIKRKALLPGFPGHRERCSCALCAKRRRASQELIDRTKLIQAEEPAHANM
jgi:hypothetical protein